MPKIFTFVYVETSQSFSLENLSPAYSSTTSLKSVNALQQFLCVVPFFASFLFLYTVSFAQTVSKPDQAECS